MLKRISLFVVTPSDALHHRDETCDVLGVFSARCGTLCTDLCGLLRHLFVWEHHHPIRGTWWPWLPAEAQLRYCCTFFCDHWLLRGLEKCKKPCGHLVDWPEAGIFAKHLFLDTWHHKESQNHHFMPFSKPENRKRWRPGDTSARRGNTTRHSKPRRSDLGRPSMTFGLWTWIPSVSGLVKTAGVWNGWSLVGWKALQSFWPFWKASCIVRWFFGGLGDLRRPINIWHEGKISSRNPDQLLDPIDKQMDRTTAMTTM